MRSRKSIPCLRATRKKRLQSKLLQDFDARSKTMRKKWQARPQQAGIGNRGGNVFDGLVDAARYRWLGQTTGAPCKVGGQYRQHCAFPSNDPRTIVSQPRRIPARGIAAGEW
jgi:hypothetical protein